MSYSDITFKDSNPIKRWLQNERLESALRAADAYLTPTATVCDFGAGNGELCKLLARKKVASIVCYEPAPHLMREAKENLSAYRRTLFASDVADLQKSSQQVVFCLEVFEHLPPQETLEALSDIEALLAPDGVAVIGVPVEVGLPALYKGCFRMLRRYGAFDATLSNVLKAFRGRPPADRPQVNLTPQLRFYPHHLGFDFRAFHSILDQRFQVMTTQSSPMGWGPALMPEIYFLLRRLEEETHGCGTDRLR